MIPPPSEETAEQFRTRIRAELAAIVPTDWRSRMQGADEETYRKFQFWWLSELRRIGLATPHWPKEWGGPGLPFSHQIIVYEELARADAPELDLMVISLFHLPATLFQHGTLAQRHRYLEGVSSGTDVWCQGFSEPGAGSDLASLRTTAVRDGDHYRVNGQKIWSSQAMHADFCLLLARTDPVATRKQAGISYFILDMKSPGVTVRPIRQITGEAEFAEIFLDEVRIPTENLIGAENGGWDIAQSTLSSERGLLLLGYSERLSQAYDRDLESGRDSWMQDAGLRREFISFHAEILAIRAMIRALLHDIQKDSARGGSELPIYIKLFWAPLLQRFTEFLVRAEGLPAHAAELPTAGSGQISGARMTDFLKSFSWTISGGSNEIMRNIISERFVGLPRG